VKRDAVSSPSKTGSQPAQPADSQQPQQTTDSSPLTPAGGLSAGGEPDGLSIAGQAGVAAGTVAGVMGLGALAWVVARRYRNRRRRRPSWPRPGLTVRTNLVAGLSPLSGGGSYRSWGAGDSPTSVASPYGGGDMTPGFHWYGRSSPVELEAESVRWG